MRSILLVVTLIIATLIITTIALSQTTGDQHAHETVVLSGEVIDGSITPEKVPDADAYRLVLGAIAVSADSSQQEKDQQVLLLEPIGLDENDLKSVTKVLADFRATYDDLIQGYNTSAEAALANGRQPEIKDFLAKRETLIESTRSALGTALTPEGMSAFHAYVQNEKKNMQVAVESAQ